MWGGGGARGRVFMQEVSLLRRAGPEGAGGWAACRTCRQIAEGGGARGRVSVQEVSLLRRAGSGGTGRWAACLTPADGGGGRGVCRQGEGVQARGVQAWEEGAWAGGKEGRSRTCRWVGCLPHTCRQGCRGESLHAGGVIAEKGRSRRLSAPHLQKGGTHGAHGGGLHAKGSGPHT